MTNLLKSTFWALAVSAALSATAANWTDAPAAVRNTFRSHMGDIGAGEYEKQTVNGQTVYQFAFQHAGQNIEMDIAENGALLKNDIRTNSKGLTPAEWNSVPSRVAQAIKAQKGNATIERFQKIRENGAFVYHFYFPRDGKMVEVALNQDGSAFSNAVASQPGASGNATVAFRDLPWTVQKPMLDQSSYARIEQVEKISADGRTVYVANYQKDGQNYQIRVADNGNVLNKGVIVTESAGAQPKNGNLIPLSGAVKVSFESLPPNVQSVVKSHANGAAIEDIDKGTLNGKVVYEAAFKRNNRTIEIRVGEDGKVLGEHFD